MPPTTFKLTGDWKKMKALVDARRLDKALEKNVKRATIHNAMLAKRAIRDQIKKRAFSPNAKLTILIKRSSKPLVDEGDLFGAVAHKLVNPRTEFVGVLRMSGDELVNLALLLHEGATIKVTEKMRGLFLVLASLGRGTFPADQLTGAAAELAERLGDRVKKVRPLKPSTTVIRIPPRPFLRTVFEDAKLLAVFRDNWQRAVEESLKV